MHMMGHGSCHCRTSSNQLRDLHTRKVSFSACTLPSECFVSLSSLVSTYGPPVHVYGRADDAAGISRPHLHQERYAPPRLRDRPFLNMERRRNSAEATFDDENEDEGKKDKKNVQLCEEDCVMFEMVHGHTNSEPSHTLEVLSSPRPKDYTIDEPNATQSSLLQHTQRPQLHHSHWSESTIQTTEIDMNASDTDIVTLRESSTMPVESAVTVSCSPPLLPNLSHGRLTSALVQLQAPIPKRPLFKAVERVEESIERGGWQTWRIVVNIEDVGDEDDDEHD